MKVIPVEIAVGSQKIHGNLYEPSENAKPLAVLFLHGWTGRPNDNAAKMLAEHGYYAMTISLRGHNTSDGDINQVSRADGLKDILMAYDYFRSQLPEASEIVAVGNSYGGYMAILLSTQRPLYGLSLRAPATLLDEGFDKPQMGQGGDNPITRQFRLTPTGYEGNRAFEALHAFKGPIQILEAELDTRVPHQSVENYRQAISNPSQLDNHFMKGWPHSMGNDPARNREFQKILLDWLDGLTAR